MASPVPSCEILSEDSRRDLVHRLFEIGALNFEGVQLKTGEISPVYFDIRLTISHPSLLTELSKHLWNLASTFHELSPFSLIVGVPAAAIPLATEISVKSNIPMILCRTAAKEYGTKRKIEGLWKPEDNCLVVEDVVTYGDSINDTTKILRSHGLAVEHAVVVVERQQGATQNLANNCSVKLHALLTFDDILNILLKDGLVSEENYRLARIYNETYQYSLLSLLTPQKDIQFFPELSQKIFSIMRMKSTCLCLHVDSSLSTTQLLSVAERVGSNICALGIHIDLLTDFSADFFPRIRKLADDLSFILIDDRKYADIRKISHEQFNLNYWCDLVTIHALPGPGLLKAVRDVNSASTSRALGAVIVAELIVNDSLIDNDYQSKCLKMAIDYQDVVVGLACQKPIYGTEHFSFDDTGVPKIYYLVAGTHGSEQSINPPISVSNTSDALKPFSKFPNSVLYYINASSIDLDYFLSIVPAYTSNM